MFSRDYCTNRCSLETFNYNPGIIGKDYDKHRIMFVLHRSDDRANPENGNNHGPQLSLDFDFGDADTNLVYSRALRKSDTGRILGWLLRDSGLTFDDVYITNLFKCLLPGDKLPTNRQYKSCSEILSNQIILAQPEKIVALGYQTFGYMFPEIAKQNTLESIVSNVELYGDGIPTLLMYHPRKLHDLKKRDQREHLEIIRAFLQHY